MAEIDYKRWATSVWKTSDFISSQIARGQAIVLTRLVTDAVQVKSREHGVAWRAQPYSSLADTVVPTICWLTVVVYQPTLVEVTQTGRNPLRLLLLPFTAEGRSGPVDMTANYMQIERIKEKLGCDNKQAGQLNGVTNDSLALQIFEFAAHLLKREPELKKARGIVDVIWACPPQVISSTLPDRFKELAVDDVHRGKIRNCLKRCLDIMTSWRL